MCNFLVAAVGTLSACSSTPNAAPTASGGSPTFGGSSGAGHATSGGQQTATGGLAATTGGSVHGGSAGASGASSLGGANHGGAVASGGSGGLVTAGANSGGVAGGSATGGAAGGASDMTPVGLHGPLKVVGTKLTDSHGSPLQLKGPSSMWLNWQTQKFAEDKQGLAWLRDNWKATVIRAAMGVTTTDTKDQDYLTAPEVAAAQVDQIVQNAIDLGVYVIIDWHDSEADRHQAQAIEFFSKMAQRWGSYPNVIYETFNEPIRQAWGTVIKPYHEAVIAAIRAADPDNVIILGTGNWSQDVDLAAADPVSGSNLMYTLHFYSCTHTAALRTKGQAALDKGLPLFVTEWGATNADGGTSRNPELCLDEAQLWHDWMNSNRISWAAWKFERCVDKTCYFAPTLSIPTTGDWTDDMLNGHTPFVRDRMRE
jgi:endoglucanase